MKEGSEGDGGGSSDDIPTSRDADSTVSNGHNRLVGGAPGGGLSALGGTTLANALLGLTMDRGPATNGGTTGNCNSANNNSLPPGVADALFGIHSTSNNKGVSAKVVGGVDGRDKQFVCNICHRSFGYKHVLQNHERTHTGEKPFECKECHKRFTRDHHLKTHMRLHTGEKPYHCSHCERQFVQVANLRRHLRVHTGERPYSCKICPSRFSDSNQLKAHLLIHEGKKPFECPKCNGHFRRRHHLVHHKCPNDEANIGKPRRGRRPKAYEELPASLLSPVLQERLSTPVSDLHPPPPPPMTVGLTSVITRGPSPTTTLVPQPAHMPPSRRNVHPMHHPLLGLGATTNGCFHPEQSGPLDMTVSSASAAVSVIVPLVAYNNHHHRSAAGSVDGVLDLSNSRSDSEAEPIEEEVDEEDGCVDEGIDSDSDDEEEQEHQHLRLLACAWQKQRGEDLRRHRPEDLRRHGDRYDGSEGGENGGSNQQIPMQLTTTS